MCTAYGEPRNDTPKLLDAVELYLDHGRRDAQSRVHEGQPRFVAYWEAGLGDRLARALDWVRTERNVLIDALADH